MHTHRTYMKSSQTGSALIVSLMILLVLTLIGVTAMSGSNLEEKMSGNSRDTCDECHQTMRPADHRITFPLRHRIRPTSLLGHRVSRKPA